MQMTLTKLMEWMRMMTLIKINFRWRQMMVKTFINRRMKMMKLRKFNSDRLRNLRTLPIIKYLIHQQARTNLQLREAGAILMTSKAIKVMAEVV